MSCQCFDRQSIAEDGPFIETPKCQSYSKDAHREVIMSQLDQALAKGDPNTVYRAALNALEYLQSL